MGTGEFPKGHLRRHRRPRPSGQSCPSQAWGAHGDSEPGGGAVFVDLPWFPLKAPSRCVRVLGTCIPYPSAAGSRSRTVLSLPPPGRGPVSGPAVPHTAPRPPDLGSWLESEPPGPALSPPVPQWLSRAPQLPARPIPPVSHPARGRPGWTWPGVSHQQAQQAHSRPASGRGEVPALLGLSPSFPLCPTEGARGAWALGVGGPLGEAGPSCWPGARCPVCVPAGERPPCWQAGGLTGREATMKPPETPQPAGSLLGDQRRCRCSLGLRAFSYFFRENGGRSSGQRHLKPRAPGALSPGAGTGPRRSDRAI